MRIKHNFISMKLDGTDATVVRPSNWNDDHGFLDWFIDIPALQAATVDAAVTRVWVQFYLEADGYADSGGYYQEVTNVGTVIPGQVQSNGATRRWQLQGNDLNARQFGAKFDSATDDTAAITGAINFPRNKTIRLPAGTSVIGNVVITSAANGTRIIGSGYQNSTFFLKDGTNNNMFDADGFDGATHGVINSLIFENILFNGNIGGNPTLGMAFEFLSVDFLLFLDCFAVDFVELAYKLAGCTDVLFDNCYSQGCGQGFYVSGRLAAGPTLIRGAERIKLISCFCLGTLTGDGFLFDPGVNSSGWYFCHSELSAADGFIIFSNLSPPNDIAVVGCSCHDVGHNGLTIQGAIDVKVHNFEVVRTGITAGALDTDWGYGLDIGNNVAGSYTIDNIELMGITVINAQKHGIRIFDASAPAQNPNNIRLTGSSVNGVNVQTVASPSAVNTYSGIYVDGSVRNVMIAGCIFTPGASGKNGVEVLLGATGYVDPLSNNVSAGASAAYSIASTTMLWGIMDKTQVTYGAAGSGGVGFKVLRQPN